MKKVVLFLHLSILTPLLLGQEFNVPWMSKLQNPADYIKYESEAIQCINWLMNTPLNEQVSKREDVISFLEQWIYGNQKIRIIAKQEIVTFINSNNDLVIIFLCGWVKYAFENKDYNNEFQGNIKGIESVVEFYQRNSDYLKKDRNVEKYLKMIKKGTLDDYIRKYQ